MVVFNKGGGDQDTKIAPWLKITDQAARRIAQICDFLLPAVALKIVNVKIGIDENTAQIFFDQFIGTLDNCLDCTGFCLRRRFYHYYQSSDSIHCYQSNSRTYPKNLTFTAQSFDFRTVFLGSQCVGFIFFGQTCPKLAFKFILFFRSIIWRDSFAGDGFIGILDSNDLRFYYRDYYSFSALD